MIPNNDQCRICEQEIRERVLDEVITIISERETAYSSEEMNINYPLKVSQRMGVARLTFGEAKKRIESLRTIKEGQ
jgi:hypothetical protein